MQDALWMMPAAAQAEAVRSADVSAVELVDSHLDRIAEVNPQVNAVTQLLAERAREAAAQTDRRRAAGEELGPLAGVPFTVKESTAVEGVPTTFGTERFRDLVAPADAPPVARLRAAGAIPIGHSNIPTLILAGMHTRSELFGDTVNPWDSSRTPGGSSGGDAVAVATGMAALGLGNDSGGIGAHPGPVLRRGRAEAVHGPVPRGPPRSRPGRPRPGIPDTGHRRPAGPERGRPAAGLRGAGRDRSARPAGRAGARVRRTAPRAGEGRGRGGSRRARRPPRGPRRHRDRGRRTPRRRIRRARGSGRTADGRGARGVRPDHRDRVRPDLAGGAHTAREGRGPLHRDDDGADPARKRGRSS